MARQRYRVVPNNLKGGWDIKKANLPEAISYFEHYDSAIQFVRGAITDEEAEIEVYNPEGELSWTLYRTPKGVEIDVWDERGFLPDEVGKAWATAKREKGIPQGQIQPK